MEMELEREWLEVVLKEDDAVKKVVSLSDVSSEPAVGIGENFASSINRVQMGTILGSGKMGKRSLILKRLPDDKKKNDFLESHSYFLTEIKMYSEVLPALEEVLKEQGVPPLWPGYLGFKDNILIFSDLKEKNYKVQCRKQRLDLPHALLAARTLAIFHAGTVVLKQRGLLDTSEFEAVLFARDTEAARRLMDGGIMMLSRVMAAEWGTEWSDIARRLRKKAETSFDELLDLVQVDERRLNVICHGDLWTTNLLFKYSQGMDTPIGVRFIDFQLCHYNSYAHDLIYFMMCTLPKDLRRQKRKLILESYVKTLRDSLAYHGYPELAPTMAEAEAEMERLEMFRFIYLITNTPVCISNCDSLNFNALFDEGGIAQNPDMYRGAFKEEIDEELLAWAKEGFF